MNIFVQFKIFMLEAYRELNAKKLFWLTMACSAVVVIVFAGIAIGEDHVSIFGYEWTNSLFNTENYPEPYFYKEFLFLYVGVDKWLTWFGMVLAIVSTGGLMSDFLSSGSIDMMISKPMGRWRLFFLKYLSGLLFVTLQVTFFTTSCFIVIGARTGDWEWGLFMVIPLVILFFSYLYSLTTLLAMYKCSTLTCIVLVMCFWGLIGSVNFVDWLFMQGKSIAKVELMFREPSLIENKRRLEELEEDTEASEHELEKLKSKVERSERRIGGIKKSQATCNKVLNYVYWVKTFLPKTEETTHLIKRLLDEYTDVQGNESNDPLQLLNNKDNYGVGVNNKLLQLFEEREEEQSLFWVLGTSLIFEAILLFWAGLKFSRKDF
jgi:ABC-type transport system involved in multi-copper enzyme maturation permease subunit